MNKPTYRTVKDNRKKIAYTYRQAPAPRVSFIAAAGVWPSPHRTVVVGADGCTVDVTRMGPIATRWAAWQAGQAGGDVRRVWASGRSASISHLGESAVSRALARVLHGISQRRESRILANMETPHLATSRISERGEHTRI